MEISTTQHEQALAGALTTFGWYAMPDVIRSRKVRIAAKSALLAAFTGVVVASADDEPVAQPGADESEVADETAQREIKPWTVVAGLGLLGGSLAATGVLERKIFARGERRRAEGVMGAHTRLALVAGALCAAAALVDE
ncbi:hypothetical protein [Luteococcus japonicus]|uniref:Uncharacterized protein n=1 Tax=Luteococcus japonicus LSP_Lj1 TaxID=1255658 RepID=A0A1R4J0G5_9ACTN|nr:hypothetical protein [Luteococcus japonicus]SJN25641.1 hypothetical protein FM114_04825 [Luteococcus japonicus LSP_Lj1]